jgi:plasmid stabilization system protein ParE
LRRHHAWIAEDNPNAAVDQLQRIVKAVEETLHAYPAAGSAGHRLDTRRYTIAKTPFIVEYRFRNQVLEVLRVFHHAQKQP